MTLIVTLLAALGIGVTIKCLTYHNYSLLVREDDTIMARSSYELIIGVM